MKHYYYMNSIIFSIETNNWIEYTSSGECPGNNEPEILFNLLVKYLSLFFGEDKKLIFLEYEKKFAINTRDMIFEKQDEYDEATWKEKRASSGHFSSTFLLYQYISKCEVKDDLEKNGIFKDFIDNWYWWNIICNDIFSIKKEILRGQECENLIYKTMKRKNLSFDEASKILVQEAISTTTKIYNLSDIIKENAPEHIRKLIDYMIFTIKGLSYWFSTSERYKC